MTYERVNYDKYVKALEEHKHIKANCYYYVEIPDTPTALRLKKMKQFLRNNEFFVANGYILDGVMSTTKTDVRILFDQVSNKVIVSYLDSNNVKSVTYSKQCFMTMLKVLIKRCNCKLYGIDALYTVKETI